MNSTSAQLRQQWTNPTDILTILMIIGGDVVQKALAQTAGGWITPTCFSFGWVACSFSMLVSVLGDGRLLPLPDVDVKTFNLQSGYRRENRNWVVGRLLRDLELSLDESRHDPEEKPFTIGIFVANPLTRRTSLRPRDRVQVLWAFTTIVQLLVAAVPLMLYQEWGPFLITAAGTLAVFCTGMIPQWSMEKMPARRKARKDIALTSGNGARAVIVIRGVGEALDLEDLSAAPSPLERRAWGVLGGELPTYLAEKQLSDPKPKMQFGRMARMWRGLPVGFWITRVVISCLCVFWILLLLTVAGMKRRTWYLVAVGGIGMLQNAFAAAASRKPSSCNLNVRLEQTLCGKKVMDVLMDFEVGNPTQGRVLLEEFFPGPLRKAEKMWWSGQDPHEYDKQRRNAGRDISQMDAQRSRSKAFPLMKNPPVTPSRQGTATTPTIGSVLRANNPETLWAKYQRACTLFALGRYEEAQHDHSQVLTSRQRLLGEMHVDTVESRVSLADTYRALGRSQEASDLLQQAIKDLVELYGEDAEDGFTHPKIIQAKAIHGMALLDLGDASAAEALQREIVGCFDKRYRKVDHLTHATQNDLAWWISQVGGAAGRQRAKAIYVALRQSLPTGDSLFQTVLSHLAAIAFAEQDLDQAERLQQEVISLLDAENTPEEQLVAHHFNLALVQHFMGAERQAKPKAAAENLEHAIRLAKRAFGAGSSRVQELQRTLEHWQETGLP